MVNMLCCLLQIFIMHFASLGTKIIKSSLHGILMDQPRYDNSKNGLHGSGFSTGHRKRSNGSKEKRKEIHEHFEVT